MLNLVTHLQIAGLLLLALTAVNVFIPKHLGWPRELQAVSSLTRTAFFVHLGFLMAVLALFGVVCVACPDELLQSTPLATVLSVFLFVFWLSRLVIQFTLYDKANWSGNAFRTTVHVVFALLWGYFTIVFGFLAGSHVPRATFFPVIG